MSYDKLTPEDRELYNSMFVERENDPLFVHLTWDLKCSICHKFLRNPVVAECGHRMCKDCLDLYLDVAKLDGKDYINCKEEDNDHPVRIRKESVKIDYSVIDEFKQEMVRCDFRDCRREMPYQELKDHMKVCNFNPDNQKQFSWDIK